MFSFEECKSKCMYYLQKIITQKKGTELLSTLQASCKQCMDTFESRCQTAESLRNFKTELGRAKTAYAGTTSDYEAYYDAMRNGNGWNGTYETRPVDRKGPPPEEIKQVEPYLNTCLDFIGMMIGLATTNELDENEIRKAKVEEGDRLPGWRQELQVALDDLRTLLCRLQTLHTLPLSLG